MSGLTLDALRVACAPDDHYHSALREPMRVPIGGEDWTVATDGHRLLATRGLLGDSLSVCPYPSVAEFYESARTPGGATVAIADLREFFTKHAPAPTVECATCGGKPEIECDECDGSGEVECECMECGDEHSSDCKRCDGEGKSVCTDCRNRPVIVPVAIDNIPFNVVTVAPLFAALPDETVRLRVTGDRTMTTMLGDDWFGLIMPIRNDEANVPSFSTQERAA